MFRKPQHLPCDSSLQFVTPNSRIIPSAPSKDLNAMTLETQYHTAPYQQRQFSSKMPSSSYDTLYDTYGDESVIDPVQHVSHSAGARQTFIEPNMSTMAPTSLYGSQQFLDTDQPRRQDLSFADIDFFQNTSDMESVNGADFVVKRRPSTIIEPRVQHVEIPVKIEQGQYAQASCAMIENATFQQNGGNDIGLQMAPSRSSYSSSSTTSKSSTKHPQQLTPLVIPPTPSRSASFLSSQVPISAQRSPLPSSQLTPSLTPGSYGSSPLTVSPHTPSLARQHLDPSTSSLNKKKETPGSEGEALLLEGIKYHESGKLEQATYYFHKASQLQVPMAMFFYGVSLRHGWGCQKNEPVAFQYIQKAAEHAVLDLNSLSKTVNTSASKGELIMAIYEMGVSFRHGWGCRKNKEAALHFFKIAADLGDADAQNDLGHCYYNGQGVKKDVSLAAKYYRKADKQGHGIMGNSWIWKKKYDPK